MSDNPKIDLGIMLRLTLGCELGEVRQAAARARTFLAEHKISEEDLGAIELALVEACNNAIAYAPADRRQLPVQLQLCVADSQVEIQVTDHGPGFEWPDELELPQPEAEHGRGLFIIRTLMDEARYLRARDENRLVMRKHCGTAAASLAGQATRDISLPGDTGELAETRQKLALSEQVIGTMAKELCFRSEELAAIVRCTSELGRTNNIGEFAQRLLNDLLHIAAADWFILRLLPKDESHLFVANVSPANLKLEPIRMPELYHLNGRGVFSTTVDCAKPIELEAALSQKDLQFDGLQKLGDNDPLAASVPDTQGLVRPIVMGGRLLGTLVVGRKAADPPFTADQIEVIRTFSDFLAIQIMSGRLQQEQVDLRLTAHELHIARNIQHSLLPKTFPALPGFSLSGFCLSARQVGGDFYDVLPVSEHSALLVVADVMGKGVPAALFSATLRTLLRTMAEWTHRPAELLARVNRLMLDELSGVDMFITAQLVLVDLQAGHLVVASAGHCPFLVTDHAGETRVISPDGMPLGILPDITFTEEIVPLDGCKSALLYTDGLTEARNPHGELFGEERLLNWLKQEASRKLTAAQLSENFLAELKSFQSSVSLNDDQTFLILAEDTVATQADTPAATTPIVRVAARAQNVSRFSPARS